MLRYVSLEVWAQIQSSEVWVPLCCWARGKAKQLQWSMLCMVKSRDQVHRHKVLHLLRYNSPQCQQRTCPVDSVNSNHKKGKPASCWRKFFKGVDPSEKWLNCNGTVWFAMLSQVLLTLRPHACCYLLACPGIVFFLRWEEICRLLTLKPHCW